MELRLTLDQLLTQLKISLQIDEKLKAYLYNNKIEIIDFTSGIEDSDFPLEDFYGHIIDIILDNNNTIKIIDPKAFNIITKANCKCFIKLANLIGTEIIDYNSYNKLESIETLDCITI